MKRTIVKFSGGRLSGFVMEEDAGDIPYKCSDGEGFFVLCGRCGKYMEFNGSLLVFQCDCGAEVDNERVYQYAFKKWRAEKLGE